MADDPFDAFTAEVASFLSYLDETRAEMARRAQNIRLIGRGLPANHSHRFPALPDPDEGGGAPEDASAYADFTTASAWSSDEQAAVAAVVRYYDPALNSPQGYGDAGNMSSLGLSGEIAAPLVSVSGGVLVLKGTIATGNLVVDVYPDPEWATNARCTVDPSTGGFVEFLLDESYETFGAPVSGAFALAIFSDINTIAASLNGSAAGVTPNFSIEPDPPFNSMDISIPAGARIASLAVFPGAAKGLADLPALSALS